MKFDGNDLDLTSGFVDTFGVMQKHATFSTDRFPGSYSSMHGPIYTQGSSSNINQYGYFAGYSCAYGNDSTGGYNPYTLGSYADPCFEFYSINSGSHSLPSDSSIRSGYWYQFVTGPNGSGSNHDLELTGSNTTLRWGIQTDGTAYFNSVVRVNSSLRTADGSQSAPTHTFTSDTNTGMYSSAADLLEFSTGGARRGYLNSSGFTSDSNVYTATSGTFRNYAGVWSASTGLTGNGFTFSNTVDGTAMTISSTGDVVCSGSLSATTKSFDIEHPTKKGMRLHHGSLEGPEHGVYIRGRNKGTVIELPEYWLGLVDEDTITVQLTAIGEPQNLCVANIKDNKVYVKGVEYFYFIQAERKDIEKFEVEYAV